MFGKLFNTLAMLSLAAVLAAGAFVGYLFGTGKLNGARLNLLASVLRGELDQPLSPSVPAVTPPTEASSVVRAPTEQEVRALRKRQHLEMLEAERAARDLEAQRRLLDQALQHVLQEQERLAQERAAFVQQRQRIKETARDEGFQKELAIVTSLQPRQAKEHILRTWQKEPADAIRLLNAMDESTVKRILEQFRSPEELKVQSDLLEQIRLQGLEGYAQTSGRTGGGQ